MKPKVAFTPIVAFLLGVSDVPLSYGTFILSTILFVVIPLASGFITRNTVIRNRGLEYFNNVFLKKFDHITTMGLLLTLVIIFSFQGDIILNNPLHILLIAIHLTIQTFFIFFKEQVEDIIKRVWLYVLIGVGIGAMIHNWIPQSVVENVVGSNNPFAVFLSTAIGIPMYADIYGTLPIAEALFGKGGRYWYSAILYDGCNSTFNAIN
jgi:ACR3 family arsenite efflux pump ArsB